MKRIISLTFLLAGLVATMTWRMPPPESARVRTPDAAVDSANPGQFASSPIRDTHAKLAAPDFGGSHPATVSSATRGATSARPAARSLADDRGSINRPDAPPLAGDGSLAVPSPQPPAAAAPRTQTLQLSGVDLTLELEPGVLRPVALVSLDKEVAPPANKAAQAALESIRKEFSRQVQGADETATSDEEFSAAWEEARRSANERYRTLFGQDAYLRRNIEAARTQREL